MSTAAAATDFLVAEPDRPALEQEKKKQIIYLEMN